MLFADEIVIFVTDIKESINHLSIIFNSFFKVSGYNGNVDKAVNMPFTGGLLRVDSLVKKDKDDKIFITLYVLRSDRIFQKRLKIILTPDIK